jgi:uncharacterized surface anchored protein
MRTNSLIKNMFYALLFLPFLTIGGITGTAATNLIQNPGFIRTENTPIPNWTIERANADESNPINLLGFSDGLYHYEWNYSIGEPTDTMIASNFLNSPFSVVGKNIPVSGIALTTKQSVPTITNRTYTLNFGVRSSSATLIPGAEYQMMAASLFGALDTSAPVILDPGSGTNLTLTFTANSNTSLVGLKGIYAGVSGANQHAGYDFTQNPTLYEHGNPVTVKYEDLSGNELSAPETLTGYVDDPYTTEPLDIPGYRLVNTEIPTALSTVSGAFTREDQTITYQYELDQGQVTVRHLDDQGTPIAPDQTLTGMVGEAYNTAPVVIPGYVVSNVPENATGTYTEETQTVTYVYTKIPSTQGAVLVRHVNTTGEELAPDQLLTGPLGDEYETASAKIDGYVLMDTPENATGVYTEEEQIVIYVYQAIPAGQGAILVRYIDTNGKELAPEQNFFGALGASYTTTPLDISGYTLVTTPENASGTYTEDAQIIEYIYDVTTTTSSTMPSTGSSSSNTIRQQTDMPKLGASSNILFVLLGISMLGASTILIKKRS